MDVAIRPAPYRIETPRLVLRCPEVADVRAVHEGLLESLDALRPWMPWAAGEPVSLDDRIRVIQGMRAGFDRGEDFAFMAYDAATGGFVGGMGLHPRVGPGGLELGYWIRRTAQGRGLAGEGAGALLRAAFEHMNADRVEIRIEPSNTASQRVVAKLGIPREVTLLRRFPRDGKLRDVDVYTLYADAFPQTPAANGKVRFLDALGRPWKAPRP
jgi:RimJ/RimL family protein N-acetyltransferase